MPVNVEVERTVTRFMGAFDKSGLIRAIRGYLTGQKFKIGEPTLKHKVGSDGTDVSIKITGYVKRTHYVRFNITVKLSISDMKDVEIITEGKKTKMQHGRVELIVDGSMDLDYNKRFEQNAFLEGLRNFYHQVIIKTEIDEVWQDELETIIDQVQRVAREFLDVEAQV